MWFYVWFLAVVLKQKSLPISHIFFNLSLNLCDDVNDGFAVILSGYNILFCGILKNWGNRIYSSLNVYVLGMQYHCIFLPPSGCIPSPHHQVNSQTLLFSVCTFNPESQRVWFYYTFSIPLLCFLRSTWERWCFISPSDILTVIYIHIIENTFYFFI